MSLTNNMFRLVLMMMLGALLWPLAAQAEFLVLRDDRLQYQKPVDQRTPAELVAEGVEFKGFIIEPEMALEARYDNNILAANTDEDTDYIIAAQPSLTVRKEYSGHRFIAGADANIEKFADRSQEDKEEYSAYFRGFLDLNSRWAVPFGVNYARSFRDRTSPQQASLTVEPTSIDTLGASLGILRNFNRLSVSLTGSYSDKDFGNGVTEADGSIVVFEDNNFEAWGGVLGLRYSIPGGAGAGDIDHVLYADLTYEKRNFDKRGFVIDDFTGNSSDNTQMGFLAGFETTYKGLLFANVGAGMIRQEFDDPAFQKTDRFDISADIEYNLTPKLSVQLLADRDFRQDSDFSQGFLRSNYGAGFDYEIRHNLYLDTLFTYTDFEFIEEETENQDIEAQLGLRYIHSPYLQSSAGIEYQDRTSSESSSEFDRMIFMLRLTGQI